MLNQTPTHGRFKNFAAHTSTLLRTLEALLEEQQPKVWSSAWLMKTDRRLADGLRARFSYAPESATAERPYLLTQIDPKWHDTYSFGKDQRWVAQRISDTRPEQRDSCVRDLIAVLESDKVDQWSPGWLQNNHLNLYARISRNFDCPARGVAWDEVLLCLPKELAKRFRILNFGGGKPRDIPEDILPATKRIPSQLDRFRPAHEYDDTGCVKIKAALRECGLLYLRETLARQPYQPQCMYDKFLDLLQQLAQTGNRTARDLLVEFTVKYAQDIADQNVPGKLGQLIRYSNFVEGFNSQLARTCSYLCAPNKEFFRYFLKLRALIARSFLEDRALSSSDHRHWIEAINKDSFYEKLDERTYSRTPPLPSPPEAKVPHA